MDSRLIAIILARFSLQTTHVLNTLYTLNTRVVCGETSTKNKKWQDRLIARAHILCSNEDGHRQETDWLYYKHVYECLYLRIPYICLGEDDYQKNGSSDAQIKKRTPLFVVNYTQKWWMRHLFHMNITIG